MWPFSRTPTLVPRVEVLNLQPGDFLVFETHQRITAEEARRIRKEFAEFTGMDDKRFIIVHNATLRVLREGEPPPPKVTVAAGTERRGI